MFQFVASKLTNLTRQSINGVQCVLNQVRNRTTCSKTDGKEKSVKTAMERYFRLGKRQWIRAQPGFHHHLYLKPQEKRFLQQHPVLCGLKESRMLERMAGKYYKKIKLENFVDEPFVHYQQYANKVNRSAIKRGTHMYP